MIRSGSVCSNNSVPVKFLAGSLNPLWDSSAHREAQRFAAPIIHGFTGVSPYFSHCGDDLYMLSTGDYVDFLVIRRSCDEPRAATEHMPLGANPMGVGRDPGDVRPPKLRPGCTRRRPDSGRSGMDEADHPALLHSP